MSRFMSRLAMILFVAFVHVLQKQWGVVGVRKEADESEDEASIQNDSPPTDQLLDDSASEPSDDDGDLEPFFNEADVDESDDDSDLLDDEAEMDGDDEEFLDDLEGSSALHITDEVTRMGKGLSSWSRRRRQMGTMGTIATAAAVGYIGYTVASTHRRRIPSLNEYWGTGECEMSQSDPIIDSTAIQPPLNQTTWRDDFLGHCAQECNKDATCVGVSADQYDDNQTGKCQLKRAPCGDLWTQTRRRGVVSAFFGKKGFCCLASTSATGFCGNCAQESIANGTDWCGRSAPHCATCAGAKWCVGLPTPVAALNESLYVCKAPLENPQADSNISYMDLRVREAKSGLKTFCYVLDNRRHYAYLREGSVTTFKRGVQQTCFEAFEATEDSTEAFEETDPPPLAGAMKYCDRGKSRRNLSLSSFLHWTWSRIEQGDDNSQSRFTKLCFYAFPREGRHGTQRICSAYSKYKSRMYGGGYSYLSTTDDNKTMPSWTEEAGRFCFWAFNVSVRAPRRWR
eukprot:TRINITY_DN11521_c0_g2_i3.p1 TRINITY_DN11521_c0_g2~~TRINITY_DN11521_c0_g2_i3.p1  ORF type:complete len:535 (+),score=45.20 TRINITY_DN11521_c0_g2_i3:72-1607(+)